MIMSHFNEFGARHAFCIYSEIQCTVHGVMSKQIAIFKPLTKAQNIITIQWLSGEGSCC